MTTYSRRAPRICGAVLVLSAWWGWRGAAAANPAEAAIVSTSDQSQRVSGGDQVTPFLLRLPSGAKCPGDTRHDGWQIVSFILPVSDKLPKARFSGLGPQPRVVAGVTRRLALYLADHSPIAFANLPVNREANKPAEVPPIPALSFAQPATLGLASGDYQIGVACLITDPGGQRLGPTWSAQVAVQRPVDLTSEELHWTVTSSAPPPDQPGSLSPPRVAAIVAITGAVAAFAWRVTVPRSRRHR